WRQAGSLTHDRNAHFFHLVEFTDDDFFDAFGRDGFDVSAVGELRVGHNGGRIRVHEHDAKALLLERLAGLRAGIIKLARLTNDDRAGADDEDAVNVSAPGHSSIFDLRLTIYDFRIHSVAKKVSPDFPPPVSIPVSCNLIPSPRGPETCA